MFLLEKRSAGLSPPSPPLPPAAFAVSVLRFEDSLAARLRSLFPVKPPSATDSSLSGIPLRWLSRVVGTLSLTLSDATALLADSSFACSAPDRAALAAHLDSGVAVLDASNAVLAEIDRLARRHLILRLALRILSDGSSGAVGVASGDRAKRARASITEWRSSPPCAIRPVARDLARSLAPRDVPNGRSSAVRRAIYAIEAVAGLITGAVVAAFGGGAVAAVHVSGDLPWASEFEKVAETVCDEVGAAEAEAVEAAVQKLTGVLDVGDEEMTEGIRRATAQAVKAAEELTVCLDRLSSDVNGLLRTALGVRNAALQSFRVGPQCK